ncbi:MAG TPA: iron ABC transporter permease [Rectinemataceae bacterium]|nr:iron ABC transporter permease [Rectinemataceae bacterium]
MRRRNAVLLQGFAFVAVAFTVAPLIAFALSALSGARGGGADGTIPAIGQGNTGAAISFGVLFQSIFSASTLSALRFSLVQASLSTILALIVGFPGAYFVAKYDFRGRRFFLALAAIPFCLPSILVILSFILYYGKNGWFTISLAAIGLDWKGGSLLYSLWGLVFVHAFYNFPIIIQNVGSVWAKMPRSREEAARTLGAGGFRAFSTGTLPYLFPSILQSASLVFLFCFFSFTIVLVFGGLAGTTLEVGIYRAIRFTNDRPKALALALVQTFIALLAVGAFSHFSRKSAAAKGFGNVPPRRTPSLALGSAIAIYLVLIAVFFLGPLFALAAEAFTVRGSLAGGTRFGLDNFARLLGLGSSGAGQTGSGGAPLLKAAANSLALSGSAALAATSLGMAVAASSHYIEINSGGLAGSRAISRFGAGLRGWITVFPLALSPALITAGWSALFDSSGGFLIVIGQTAIAWPFVARSLSAAFSALDKSRNEAARTLGANPLQALARVDAVTIAPSVASAAAFAFSITMGDANIPLILGSGKYETLPLLLYRLTSSYRFNEACAVGIVLALFTSVAFFFKEGTNEPS